MSIWAAQIQEQQQLPLTDEVKRMNASLPLLGPYKLKEKFRIESYQYFVNDVVNREGKTLPVEFVHMIVTTESNKKVETRTAAPRIMNIFRQSPDKIRRIIALGEWTRYVHMPGENPGDYGYWILE